MIPVNLGQSAARIGLAQALAQPQQQRRVVGDVDKSPQYGASARNYGLAEALQPISIDGGGWGEALAEALAGGLRGRAAQSERQGEVDQEQWGLNQAEKTQGMRNSAISEALQGFDPTNPQAMVGALSQGAPDEALSLAGALAQRQGTSERYGPLEQIDGRLGQPNLTTGQYDWAPQVTDYGNRMQPGMPVQGAAGYVWGPNGTMQTAQGGPAERRVNTEQAGRARAALARIEDQSTVTAAIDRAIEMAGSGETGAMGAIMRNVPGTQAFDLDAQLDVIRANLAFDALMEMRANSPTGGALGAVSERELLLLQSTMEALSQSQSRDQFIAGLQRLRQTYQMSMARIRAAYESDFGQGAPMMSDAPAEEYVQPGAEQNRVLQFNPQTGRVE